jgi:catechol 2,3-dioxygenase-like lactoylglutathione lyase family enzyme
MRLRQICLVARELETNADDLTQVLGLSVAFRDPGVGRFGLANIVTPIDRDFLEIVAPIQDGTSAGRYLDRRRGDGGYMVILQGDDAARDRERLKAQGVRAVEVIERPTYHATHFHPADTGGILLSIDSVPGGDWNNPDCEWMPAGPAWRQHRRDAVSRNLVGAELQSDDPDGFAALWSTLLGAPVGPGRTIRLSNATLRFVQAEDGRGRGLGGIDVTVADKAKALGEAKRRGLAIKGDTVTICGTRVRLVA